jgi:hypothetical protein
MRCFDSSAAQEAANSLKERLAMTTAQALRDAFDTRKA